MSSARAKHTCQVRASRTRESSRAQYEEEGEGLWLAVLLPTTFARRRSVVYFTTTSTTTSTSLSKARSTITELVLAIELASSLAILLFVLFATLIATIRSPIPTVTLALFLALKLATTLGNIHVSPTCCSTLTPYSTTPQRH